MKKEPVPLQPWQTEDAARLKALFKKFSRLTQAEFGAEHQIGTQGMVWQYLNGRRPLNSKAAMAFAKGLGVAVKDISPTIDEQVRAAVSGLDVQVENKAEKPPLFDKNKTESGVKLTDGRPIMNIRPVLEWDNESELGEEYVLIPRLDIKVSAGNGRIVWEIDEKGQKQAFRKSWVARLGIDPGQAATVVADGSSMEPRIIDGDSLIVDYKSTRLVDGKIYVLAYQNEVYVKRLFKKPGGGLTIRSDNPDKARYPDMDVLPEHTEHVQIIARVVGLSGTL